VKTESTNNRLANAGDHLGYSSLRIPSEEGLLQEEMYNPISPLDKGHFIKVTRAEGKRETGYQHSID
jgi:hypothetical protein